MSENEQKRYWECRNCHFKIDRHHAETNRPFCDKCEFRHAVLIEMTPKGKDTEKFYDDDGNGRNVSTES